MMIPVRCFTCGKVVASAFEAYTEMVDGGTEAKQALDQLGLERFCCRRMIVAHKQLIGEAARYE